MDRGGKGKSVVGDHLRLNAEISVLLKDKVGVSVTELAIVSAPEDVSMPIHISVPMSEVVSISDPMPNSASEILPVSDPISEPVLVSDSVPDFFAQLSSVNHLEGG